MRNTGPHSLCTQQNLLQRDWPGLSGAPFILKHRDCKSSAALVAEGHLVLVSAPSDTLRQVSLVSEGAQVHLPFQLTEKLGPKIQTGPTCLPHTYLLKL